MHDENTLLHLHESTEELLGRRIFVLAEKPNYDFGDWRQEDVAGLVRSLTQCGAEVVRGHAVRFTYAELEARIASSEALVWVATDADTAATWIDICLDTAHQAGSAVFVYSNDSDVMREERRRMERVSATRVGGDPMSAAKTIVARLSAGDRHT